MGKYTSANVVLLDLIESDVVVVVSRVVVILYYY